MRNQTIVAVAVMIFVVAVNFGCHQKTPPNSSHQKETWSETVDEVNNALSCPWFNLEDDVVKTPIGRYTIQEFKGGNSDKMVQSRITLSKAISNGHLKIEGVIEISNDIEGEQLKNTFARQLFNTLEIKSIKNTEFDLIKTTQVLNLANKNPCLNLIVYY